MTSTLTKTSTNTRLAVATAFLAASAAFAMIPAGVASNKFQGCRDSDAGGGTTFVQSQLFVKSTTTYNGGMSTDRCYTFPTTGKTYVMEGVCKDGGFQTWQKNCGELNLGKTGVNYQCVEGACVNVLANNPSSTPWLTVSTATLSVPADAGTNSSITVASNASWTVSDNQTWLTVLPAAGTNNGTLQISYTSNTATFNRRGVVTVIGGGITQNIEVTQVGVSSVATSTILTVSPAALQMGAALNSSNSVNLSSNVNWTVNENIAWLTVSPLMGSNNATLLFVASQANTSAASRSGAVTITGGGITRTITVTQSALSATSTASTTLSVSPTAFSTAAFAGARSISVSSNVNWTVSDNQDWLTVLPAAGFNNGNFIVSYAANTLTTGRTGVVTVVGGGITRTISVTQNAPSSTPTSTPVTTATSTLLDVTIDTNYTGLRNDHYVLAGTQKHLVGRILLYGFGEDIKLKQLALNFLSSNSLADVKNTFHSITIYKDSAMTIPLAIMPMSLGTVVFQNLNHVVPKNTSQYFYIGVGLNSIGPASNTSSAAVSNISLNFGLKDAETAAMGVVSGVDVLPQNVVVTENVYTKTVTSIGSQITNVASTFQNGNLAGGEQTFFTFAVTADSGVNTDVFGDSLGAYLVSMKLQLATDANVTSTKLCRVSTGSCISLYAVPTAVSGVYRLQTQTPGYTGFVNFVLFDNLGAGGMSNRIVQNDETVLYEVRGTFSNATDRYAQGSIQDVHDSGIVWGYDTRGYGGEPLDITFTDLKKMEPRWSGYPDVVGGTLN